MFKYFISFIALFSTLLLIIAFIADIINSKNLYLQKNEKEEVIRAKYKVVLAIIISLSWSYFLI